jgi:hypothetical protein
MNRYSVAALLLTILTSPAIAQYPISGAFPPWSAGVPPTPAYSPREAPIITQIPMRYIITDQVINDLRRFVPDSVLLKLTPLKLKEFSQTELMALLGKELRPGEVNQFKEYIFYYSQIAAPRLIQVPAGQPLVGYYKMDGLLVGADGRYPFDTGEYNLAGFAGNARIYGSFEVTPPPASLDPLNSPIYTCSLRACFHRMQCR